jgi:hypothetical protein
MAPGVIHWMTGPLLPPVAPRTPAATGGIGFALGASALVHWALLAVPVADTPQPGAGPTASEVQLTVRLAVPPATAPGAPAVTVAASDAVPGIAAGKSGQMGSDAPSTPIAPPGVEASLALRTHDPTYYPVNELDVYPHLTRPLDLERLPVTGRIRLRLLIDEHGHINDITPAEVADSHPDTALIAALAAARFIPARKNGRYVKSSVLLSVGPGPASGDR